MSSHLNKLLGLFLFIILSLACATDEERRDNRQAKCASAYGYQYGTDAMAQCVERMGRQADQAFDRIQACNAAYGFGTTAYNLCVSR
jgi:hypothetical protein